MSASIRREPGALIPRVRCVQLRVRHVLESYPFNDGFGGGPLAATANSLCNDVSVVPSL